VQVYPGAAAQQGKSAKESASGQESVMSEPLAQHKPKLKLRLTPAMQEKVNILQSPRLKRLMAQQAQCLSGQSPQRVRRLQSLFKRHLELEIRMVQIRHIIQRVV
jgi:hypothetical protein